MHKLGTATGSLVNYLYMNAANGIQPEVGMGVTFYHWSDRSAGTIQEVEVIKGKTYIHITADEAKRIDNNGFSEMQDYEFIQNPDGHRSVYRFDETKRQWVGVYKNPETGRWKIRTNSHIRIGERDAYHDFSF